MSDDVERAVPRIPTGWEEEHLRDPLDLADSLQEIEVEVAIATVGDGVDWRSLAIAYAAEREILRERVHDLEEMLHRERFG